MRPKLLRYVVAPLFAGIVIFAALKVFSEQNNVMDRILMDEETSRSGLVTVNFRDVDVDTVFNYLSEVSGKDIVTSPGVTGTVTMRLREKPWQLALDIVARNHGYVYSHEGNIIRVIPQDQIHSEAPVTELIPLNHVVEEIELSKANRVDEVLAERREESLGKLLEALGGMVDVARGETVTYVPGINSIIVSAIPSRVDRIRELMREIDLPSPQVMLSAKVIEISLEDDEKFGVDWQTTMRIAGARRPITFPFSGTGFLGMTRFYGDAGSFPTAGDDEFTFGTLDFSQFSATLDILEERGNAEVLSAPRITTLNNRKATIKVVEKIMLQRSVESLETDRTVVVEYETEDQARESGVILTVLPHVNREGDITVNLFPEVSVSTFKDITISGSVDSSALVFNSRQANTTVRVKDGETIFIGGLIREDTVSGEKRFPILGNLFEKIPLLRSLFIYETEAQTRSEVVFFVTVNLVSDGMHSMSTSGT